MYLYYDNSSYIFIDYEMHNAFMSKYEIKLMTHDKKTIAYSEKEHANFIVYLGIIDNTIVLIKLDDTDYDSPLTVNFYSIEENKITKIKNHIIYSEFSVNNTMINVSKMDESTVLIVWSDLYNENYLKIATVTQNSCDVLKYSNDNINENNFYQLYTISTSDIFIINSYGHHKNLISIIANNINNDFVKYKCHLEGINHLNDEMVFDTNVIECLSYNDKKYILINLKIMTRTDVLHLKKSNVFLLLKEEKNELILIDKIEKSNFRPSICIKNNEPCIFYSGMINKF